MLRLKRNDKVIVIAGRSKGTIGSILQVLGEDRLLVSGVNMVHKHVKPNPQKGVKGGIEKRESSIHVSNVAIYNEQMKKPDHVGYKTLKDGKKVRVFKSTGEVIS